MGFPSIDAGLIEAAGAASTASNEGLGVDFWAAVLSLATALVVTAGPPILRKVFPPDSTVADIAKSSSESVAASLDKTLELVRDDFSALREKIEENSRKIDAIKVKGKGKP